MLWDTLFSFTKTLGREVREKASEFVRFFLSFFLQNLFVFLIQNNKGFQCFSYFSISPSRQFSADYYRSGFLLFPLIWLVLFYMFFSFPSD